MESKNKANNQDFFIHSALGAAVGVFFTVVAMLVMSVVLVSGNFGEDATRPMSNIAFGIGALCSGYAAARFHKRKGWLVGFVSGMAVFLLFLIIGLISGTEITTTILVRIAICAAASALGGIIGVNKKEKRKYN